MQTNRKNPRLYRVRILDFKYQHDFGFLTFTYLTYEVMASNEKLAIKKAQKFYKKGQKEAFSEELPFILKLFSVDQKKYFNQIVSV